MWQTLFAFGHDYFHNLEFASDDEAREAAREPWQRLGEAFMAAWTATKARPVPWALGAFGSPNKRSASCQ